MPTLTEMRAMPLNRDIAADALAAIGAITDATAAYATAQESGSSEEYRAVAAMLAVAANELHQLEAWCDFVAAEIDGPDEFNVRDYDLEQRRKEWVDD